MAWGLVALLGWWLYHPGDQAPNRFVRIEPPVAGEREALAPLPDVARLKLDARRVALGRRLFSDPRLSADATVSCASCHNLARGGADTRAVSVGAKQHPGVINAPSVYNSLFNFAQFWDGRAADLYEQLDGPISSRTEFDSDWPGVLRRLGTDTRLVRDFESVYPGGLNVETVRDALVEFESSLLTPSRFDRYLRGDDKALSDRERRGYQLFLKYGCVACHQGVNVGGNLYQRLGVARDYFAGRAYSRADQGRFNVTHAHEDMHVFKVPGLRNVALTAPYFHDASAATLEAAVMLMARYQLDVELPGQDLADLVAFLASLTGEKLPQ